MHFTTEEPQCSKCGQRNSETFQRGQYVSGRRCLSCGHEQVQRLSVTPDDGQTYVLQPKGEWF